MFSTSLKWSYLPAIFVGFMLFECLLYYLARKFHVGAEVNERSSHTSYTPTCGGLIIPLALLAWAVFNVPVLSGQMLLMMSGALILAIVSFIDDVLPLSAILRLVVQIAVLVIVFYSIGMAHTPLIYILAVAGGICCVNSFNFIDGIAGMLCLYGLVVICSLAAALYIYLPEADVQLLELCVVVAIAMVAFGCFNIPDKFFAGDVGAIPFGYLVSYILLVLFLNTKNPTIIILVAVGGLDACLTTLVRLLKGKNILKPHCECVYQILTKQCGLPHLVVAAGYASLQFVISVLYLTMAPFYQWPYLVAICILLTAIFFYIRARYLASGSGPDGQKK